MTSHPPAAAAGQRRAPAWLPATALLLFLRLPATAQTALPAGAVRLPGHLSALAARSHALGRMNAAVPVRLTLALPPRDPQGMDDLLRRIYDPQDPLYGHYLTPDEFSARFGATGADYQVVMNYARAQGLTVVGAHPDHLLLDVAGPAQAVEAAFAIRLQQYQAADGRVFHAPDAAPAVPAAVAARLAGVFGLDSSLVAHPYRRRLEPGARPQALPIPGPGTGPMGGLTPLDTKTAYGLTGTSLDGSGQTLGLLELDGYAPNDVRAYENQFGLPLMALENVSVDGATGQPGSGADEVTLDIELITALAPRAKEVLVYEGPNSDASILDIYSKIANDDRTNEVSTSWGLNQAQFEIDDPGFLNAENRIFQQMAMQGQAVFAAAGDNGAYDDLDSSHLSVDDPGSQPFVTGVGGTTLATHGPGGTRQGETTWNDDPLNNGAGGGGISGSGFDAASGPGSPYWPIPSYQVGAVSAASLGSTTMRNVPDVSLDADPNSGYSIYFQGGWVVYGGASTAAPLWAGFTALVNQQRAATGQSVLGFANPSLYAIGKGAAYSRDFHDIADGSSNGTIDGDTSGVPNPSGQYAPPTTGFPAVPGYDLATGWGTFNGANLLADLSGSAQPSATSAPFTFPAGLNFFSMPDPYTGLPLDGLFGGTHAYFVLNPASNLYNTLTAPTVQPGIGYWVNFASPVTVTQAGTAVSATTPFTIALSPGWNQIGDPFPTPVPVVNLQVVTGSQTYPFTTAPSASLIYPALYRYDTPSGQYVLVTANGGVLTPLTGYWLYARQAVVLQVPPP